MKKLIQVVRGSPDRGTEFHLLDANVHRHPQVIRTQAIDFENDHIGRAGEFFLAEERDAPEIMRVLAQLNPGCEVRIYNCEQIAQCPAGDMVVKKISASGVLPS